MEKIWFKDVKNFINETNFSKFLPTVEMTLSEQLNALLRFSIYFSVVIFLIKKDTNIFLAPLGMAAFTYFIYTVDYNNKNERKILEKLQVSRDPVTRELCTTPTKDNPFMNVLMHEYSASPSRPGACALNGKVKKDIKNRFDTNLYRDVDDIFHKKASDRQFYTMPNTKIPNDSVEYAKWLYGSSKTCKEGDGIKCYDNTFRISNV